MKCRSSAAIAALVLLHCHLTAPAQSIVINEVMTANSRTLLDENGDSPDWIELYNPGAAPVRLTGYGLSDDPALPFKWTFRDATIEPGSFLLVFASGKDRQPGIVAPTKPPAIAGQEGNVEAVAARVIRSLGVARLTRGAADLDDLAHLRPQGDTERCGPVRAPARRPCLRAPSPRR